MTGSVPVDPEVRSPDSSTRPSKRALEARLHRNCTPGITALLASRASAVNRSVSPAVTTFCTGETMIRAMRDGAWGVAAVVAGSCAARASGAQRRRESTLVDIATGG